jgi:hypothetical protein
MLLAAVVDGARFATGAIDSAKVRFAKKAGSDQEYWTQFESIPENL